MIVLFRYSYIPVISLTGYLRIPVIPCVDAGAAAGGVDMPSLIMSLRTSFSLDCKEVVYGPAMLATQLMLCSVKSF